MRSANGSNRSGSDNDWYGTNNYEEAKNLIIKGFTDILDKLRLGIQKTVESHNTPDTSKSYIIEDVCGYVPIIPNYLQGLPKSMFHRQSVTRKIKTIHLIYGPSANSGVSPENFIKAGIALLSAIKTIEKSNITIKLDCMFFASFTEQEAVIGLVQVKDYKDRLDLQKLCFPMAHPSMERRIGFKFLETIPELEDPDFTYGYGSAPNLTNLKGILKLPKDTVLLTLKLINGQLNNDPCKIIEYINKRIKEDKYG